MEPPPSPPRAEDLFADFLDRVEAGEAVDFAAFAAAAPAEHRPALHRIHARWSAMSVAFTALSQSPASAAAAASSASLSGLLERLGHEPQRWHRYALGGEIARGAMGRVLRAWDQELRRDVALKVQRTAPQDGRMRRRFVEEAQITAQLDHPGIVPIHELGVDAAGQPFFAMRLVRGSDLGAVIQLAQRGAEGWSVTRVLHVLLRVCEAVAYAHHKGVVHRDLKPQNVMVGRFGETYVMDWGLARALGRPAVADDDPESQVETVRAEIAGEDEVSPLLTRSGDVVGTPSYMAPEQAAGGGGAATAAVDVYALGAILYHLLAGHPPYLDGRGSTADEVLAAVRLGPPAPLPDAAPAELRAICERAMAREPAQRYGSVQELGDDLLAYLELRVVRAYGGGRFGELRKWIARHRALSALSGALVLALGVGLALTSRLWLAADSAQREAAATADRLATELDKSGFRNARLALRLDDPTNAAEVLRRHHLDGRWPRATAWALREVAMRNPVLATARYAGPRTFEYHAQSDALLTLSEAGHLQVRDPQTLAVRSEVAVPDRHLTLVAAPDGASWAAVGDREGGVHVLSLPDGAVLQQFAPAGPLTCLECAEDGTAIAAGGDDGGVRWWPAPDAAPRLLPRHRDGVHVLAFAPGATHLGVGLDNGGVVVHGADGSASAERRLGGGAVISLSFAPDGRELWCGTQGLTVLAVPSGEVLRSMNSTNGTFRSLRHDRRGGLYAGGWWRIDRFAAGAEAPTPVALHAGWRLDLDPGEQRLWSLRTTGILDLVDIGERWLRRFPGRGALALAGDGRTVVLVEGREAVRHDLATGRVTGRASAPGGGWIATDQQGRRAALVGRGSRGLRIVDLDRGELLFRSEGPTDPAFNECAVFTPDGARLAAIQGRDRIALFDVASGAKVREWHVPDARLLRLRCSGDGRWLLAGWRGARHVRLFDLHGEGSIDVPFELPQHDGVNSTIAALAIDQRGERIAIGNWQGDLLVIDRTTGRRQSLRAHQGTTWSLHFLPGDPGTLVSSAGAGGLTFWDLDSGEACFQPMRPKGPVAQVQISADGSTLACYSDEGCVAVDLTYHERHVAGTLGSWLPADVPPAAAGRAAALRAWAADVLQRPWPRWR